MGIKNMLKFLNNNYPHIIKNINNDNFNGNRIAIDISILLYQIIIAIRNSGADMTNKQGDITSHILGLFNKTINFLKLNIIPVYVFDGKPPVFKQKVIEARRDVKMKAYCKLSENLSEEDKIKYFKRTVSITKKQIDECKELLDCMGIPYVVAPEEADSQCAQLVKAGLVDGVLTEDMDILTFGSHTIYRNLASHTRTPIKIELNDILIALKLSYEQFVELCILFGCDYSDKLFIKSEMIYKYYLKYKNMNNTINALIKDKILFIKNLEEHDISNYTKYKEYFINPPVHNIKIIDMKKPRIKELDDLLVLKYGLVRMKIYNKLVFLDNYVITH